MDNLLDKLEFIIIVSDELCKYLDDITYTIFLSNKSGKELNNVFIPINIPEFTEFIEDSLYINGKKSDLKSEEGIKIKKLPKNNILIFSYKVKITSMPREYHIENKITLYLVKEEKGKIRCNKNISTNKAITRIENNYKEYLDILNDKEKTIINTDVEVFQSIDIEEGKRNKNSYEDENIFCSLKAENNISIIGEENIYYATIYNNGNMDFEECKLVISNVEKIEIKEITIIRGSDSKNLNKGLKEIEIESIKSKQRIIVKIICEFNENNKDKVSMKFKVSGKLNIRELSREIFKEYYSNNCIVKLENPSIKVFLTSDKEFLVKNEKVNYKTTIINDGSIPVSITYYMNVSKGLNVLKKEICINGNLYKSKSKKIECVECYLLPGQGIEMDIPCKYIRSYGKNKVHAEGIVKYDYYIEECNFKGSKQIKTEKIYADATISTFKEILIEKNIELENLSSETLNISNVYVEPSIKDYYIMSMNRGLSYENREFEKDVIMVSGGLKIIIEYADKENISEMKLFLIENNFSTFLELPDDYIRGELEGVNVELQGIYYKLIGDKELLLNINLLINTTL